MPEKKYKNKRFETIDGETLMNLPYQPTAFVVNSLIGQGLHLLAGEAKVGKSWLALWLSVCVAKGDMVWNMETKQGTVLYLCLEDNLNRIQNRLLDISDDVPASVHFAMSACQLGKGLEYQIKNFVNDYPDTVLIIVDTLQIVRGTSDNSYKNDYEDLIALKNIADENKIAVLLIHHLRKEEAKNSFNRISGTMAIQGAVDSSFTLIEEKQGSRTATLSCIGRDIENRDLELKRSKENIWELVYDSSGEPKRIQDIVVSLVESLLEERKRLTCTPAELAKMLNGLHKNSDDTFYDRSVFNRLKKSEMELSALGIYMISRPSNGKRLIELYRDSVDGADDFVSSPGALNIAPVDPVMISQTPVGSCIGQ